MATWDFRRLQQYLDKHPPHPLYFLCGEEPYLVREARKLLKGKVLTDVDADFNSDEFICPEHTAQQVRDTVEMLPMMCERRLVVYREVHKLKDKDWEHLLPVLESPLESCVLVLEAEKVDKRKKYFKKILDNGIVLELNRPYDNQIPLWVEYIALQNKIRLSKEQCMLVYQLVGCNLGEIDNEIRKLKQYCGTEPVRDENIFYVISESRVDSIFDLTTAIGNKDRAGALVCLANLLAHGQNEVGAVALISRHLRILNSLHEGVSQGLTGGKLSAKAGVPQFFLKQYLSQSQLWDSQKIRSAMDSLYKTDKALKSSPVSAHIWLENFIIHTCQ